eukprot:2603468-Amphidinium_carterae.1
MRQRPREGIEREVSCQSIPGEDVWYCARRTLLVDSEVAQAPHCPDARLWRGSCEALFLAAGK